ncbi:site-specific integrase [Pseudomonas tohonis]|uniref:site-specific integrase n=1 Tax=Pseudomonas tohonis TaxID=2725477 RepID=UPI00255BDF58|nr:site-specific integrase [Pseudomonas tohonis]
MSQPKKDPRSGIYYIRRRVPEDVQPLLPHLGEFYKRSLRTTCPLEAKVRHATEWVKSQELFDLARHQSSGTYQPTARDAVQLAARWAKRELEDLDQTGDFTRWLVDTSDGTETLGSLYGQGAARALIASDEFGPAWTAAVAPHIQDELNRNGLPPARQGTDFYRHLLVAFVARMQELSDVAYKRYHDDHASGLDLPMESPLTAELARRPEPENRLSKVFIDWCQWTRDTDGEGRDVLKRIAEYGATIQRFVELQGDLPVESIRRTVVQEFQTQLRRMPSKGAGIRSMTAKEQIAKADAENLPRLGTTTVKNRLMALSSVLSYAARLELVAENPVTASGITRQLAKAANKAGRMSRRKHHERHELVQIFSSPVFTQGWRSPRANFGEAWFWLPLLLCYTGARREEVAQLQVNEVRESDDGIWYLSLLATPDESDVELNRTMKTLGSHRVVALHPDVIELGFLSYVRTLPAKGPLFPGLAANPGGWYGHNFGKRWSEYLKTTAGLNIPVAPSHGFRHTFKTMCREMAIPEEIHDAITGHDNGSVSRKYGDRHLLSVQAEQIKRLPSIARLAGLLPTAT